MINALFRSGIMLYLCSISIAGLSQDSLSGGSGSAKVSPAFFRKISSTSSYLDRQLTRQTTSYLDKMAKCEARLRKKLSGVDSAAAQRLFGGSSQQYAAYIQKLHQDTVSKAAGVSGEYLPYADSLHGALAFLQQHPQYLSGSGTAAGVSPQLSKQLQGSMSNLQTLEGKMQNTEEVRTFLTQRQQTIASYLNGHPSLQGLMGSQFSGYKQQLYYYSQQVRQYKQMLNSPDQMEQKALATLDQLQAYKSFMKNNSQLAGMFGIPSNYGSPSGVLGLQTKDQVTQIIQSQVAAGGAGGQASLQANLASAESQLSGFKNKLSQLGAGSGGIEEPDFKPNNQKTKTFWKRLEYGANFQTTRNNYAFPTVTDFGVSIGYKINDKSDVGVGASYKLGWGNGIQHVAFSSQGAGLRSFMNVKIKSSFSATGGFEYNYETPFTTFQGLWHSSYWTRSGLIGVTKTISVKSRVFKQTQLQLLWDFLSYQQVPKTQPILFRIGYNF